MAGRSVHIKRKDDSKESMSADGGQKEAANRGKGSVRQQSPKNGAKGSGSKAATANESVERRESAETQESDNSENGTDVSKKKKGNAKFSNENQTLEYYIDAKGNTRPKHGRSLKGVPGAAGTSREAGESKASDSSKSKAKGNGSPEEARNLQEDSVKKVSSGAKGGDEEATVKRESAEEETEAMMARQLVAQGSAANIVRPGGKQNLPTPEDEELALKRESPKDEVEARMARQSAARASVANIVRPGVKQNLPTPDDEELALKRESPKDEVEARLGRQSVARASVASIIRPGGKQNLPRPDDEELALKRESPDDEVEARKARQSGIRATLANGGKQNQSTTDQDGGPLKRESPEDGLEAWKSKQSGIRASMVGIVKSTGLEENTRKSFTKDDEGDGHARKSIRQSITELPAMLRGASMRQVMTSNTRIRGGSITVKDPDKQSMMSTDSKKKGVSMMKRLNKEDQVKTTDVQNTDKPALDQEGEVGSNRGITASSMKSLEDQGANETPRASEPATSIRDSKSSNQNPSPQAAEGEQEPEAKGEEMEVVPPIPPAVVETDEDQRKEDQPVSLGRTTGSEDLKEGLTKSVRPGSVVLVSGRKDDEGFYRVRVAQPSKVFAYNVGAKASARFSTLIDEVVEGIAGSLKKSGDDHSVYTAYTQTGDSQNVRNSILSAVTQVSPKRSTKTSVSSHNVSTNTDQQQTGYDEYDPIMSGWKMDRLHWNNNLYS